MPLGCGATEAGRRKLGCRKALSSSCSDDDVAAISLQVSCRGDFPRVNEARGRPTAITAPVTYSCVLKDLLRARSVRGTLRTSLKNFILLTHLRRSSAHLLLRGILGLRGAGGMPGVTSHAGGRADTGVWSGLPLASRWCLRLGPGRAPGLPCFASQAGVGPWVGRGGQRWAWRGPCPGGARGGGGCSVNIRHTPHGDALGLRPTRGLGLGGLGPGETDRGSGWGRRGPARTGCFRSVTAVEPGVLLEGSR